jgi:hypothetical protein
MDQLVYSLVAQAVTATMTIMGVMAAMAATILNMEVETFYRIDQFLRK